MLRKIFLTLWLLYFAFCVFYLITYREEHHWDFKMQYFSAKLIAEGKNPYDPEVTRKEIGTPLWYAYPPITLWFYRLFILFNYETACLIFFLIKITITLFLLFFWSKHFLNQSLEPDFLFFCLFAFNAALYLDIRSGNFNMLEQALIWLSFYFFLKNKLWPFCAFILLAASFKMAPLFFLILLLITKSRKKYFLFFSSLGFFLGYLFLQYLLWPDMFRAFLGAARGTLVEKRIIAPTTIGFILDAFDQLAKRQAIVINIEWQIALFVIVIALILILSFKAYRKLTKYGQIVYGHEDTQKIILFGLCLVYALINLRMKDYSYVLLLVPSYFILKTESNAKAFPFLYILSILTAAKNATLPGTGTLFLLIWEYYPLLLAYLFWALYLKEIFSLKRLAAQ